MKNEILLEKILDLITHETVSYMFIKQNYFTVNYVLTLISCFFYVAFVFLL